MRVQNIETIKIKDLYLWTENPRDPIETDASDIDVIKRAISESSDKWNLPKLLKEMGEYYDLSELPIVVKYGNKYIVYDGNRRVAVIKYLQSKEIYQSVAGKMYFPDLEPREILQLTEIPCNVCDKNTALESIERKHINSGSWGQLERDYFEYKHRGKQKSIFVMLDEQTGGYIGKNKIFNKRFVKEEVLTAKNLEEIGFTVNGEMIISPYNEDQVIEILDSIKTLLENGTISTRNNRTQLKDPLTSAFPNLIHKDPNEQQKLKPVGIIAQELAPAKRMKKTPRSKNNAVNLFDGEKLILEKGEVNNIVRDMEDIFGYYMDNKQRLSKTFPVFLRMGLRLLVESASKKNNKRSDLSKYVKDNFSKAKNNLTQDRKTYLSSQAINNDGKLIELLQSGGHNYTASGNINQTIAMSIIIKEMLKNTHGKGGLSNES